MDSPICGIFTSSPLAEPPSAEAAGAGALDATFGCAGVGCPSACGAGAGGASGVAVGGASCFGGSALESATAAGCAAPSPMTATTVPTATVSPSCTLISVSVPDTDEGISASTLSVEISNN